MNISLLFRHFALALFFALSLAFPARAALQVVSALNPAMGAPANGNGDSWAPLITPDGRYVLFASTAANLALSGPAGALIPVNQPPSVNVYLTDRIAGTTTLVSVNQSGTGGGNGNSLPTGLSTNGQYALFESTAGNLVTNDNNNANDVFVRDLVGRVTTLVSTTPAGSSGNGASRWSTLTPDGRYVAFVSSATNLVANDTNGIPDVFVRDLTGGTTVLVSAGAQSATSASTSEAPEITPDGRYVAFYSSAVHLVAGVTNTGEIYRRDLLVGTTSWASTNARSISKIGVNGFCYNHALSDNGQYVAYEISPNTANPTNGCILLYNALTATTTVISTNAVLAIVPFGANPELRSLNLTPDGQTLVYAGYVPGASCIYLWNAQAATNRLVSVNQTNGVSPNTSVLWPDVDPTGRYVVFYSTDPNLTASTNGALFLRDTLAGATTLVSVDTNGANLTVDPPAVPALSASGSVAFESPHANLDGRSFLSDVFVRDLTNNVASFISAHAPSLASLTANGASALWSASVSTNGRYVAFSTFANNLTTNDVNTWQDVYVRDLVAGTNVLVSVNTNGVAGNSLSTEASLSGDGRFVAFASGASDLLAGDSQPQGDVYVRNLSAGTTALVSVSTTGGFGTGLSDAPTIGSDGRFVLFSSTAQNLVTGTSTGPNLFLRDRQLSRTYALTTGSFVSSAMTPNGDYVAFVGWANGATATNLYIWNSLTAALIYTNASPSLTNVALSPDGQWLAYVSGLSLYAYNVAAKTNVWLARGPFPTKSPMQFSGDDRFLVYTTVAGSAADTNHLSDVYLYDLVAGTNLLVSQNFTATGAGTSASDSATISPDGRFVAYRSSAGNSVAGATNNLSALFLYDRLTATTILLTANQAGTASGNNRASMPVFSADSQTLLFQSWASDLVPQDFNSGSDLFALSLAGFQSNTNQTTSAAGLQPQIVYSPNAAATAGQTVIAWPFTPGTSSYAVQFKNNLSDPAWQNLNGNLTVLGGRASLNDLAPAAAQRFYRIVLNN